MNILFVSCTYRMFDGIDCGAANRSTLFVEALSKVGHVDVVNFSKDSLSSNVSCCDVVCNKNSPPQLEKKQWQRLMRYLRCMIAPWMPSAHYVLDQRCEEVVDRLMRQKPYDLVACRYIGEAVRCGLQKYADRLVVDIDDNLVSASLRDINNADHCNVIIKTLLTYKAHAIGLMQKRFLRNVRLSFYSNILEPTSRRSVFLPNATTQDRLLPDITPSTPRRLLIVGWLDFAPNRYGALHFASHVFPKIRAAVPDAELHIVGKTTDERLKDRLNAMEGVRAMGFVDDITAEYEGCRVVIVPVYQGAGTSVKFVEGLMMNRPMVSTPLGARGFEKMCCAGTDFLLAHNDTDFADKITALLRKPDEARRIAQNAYATGQSHFSKEHFEKIVTENILHIHPL